MAKDVVIVGAGAAGLMCAIEAGKRGRSVLVLEHNEKIGEKIRISGGGRCNFTNLHVEPRSYISQNLHFCKSALARYTSSDFISLLDRNGVKYHEKKLGQLFCDNGSQQIIDLLMKECKDVGAEIQISTRVSSIGKKRNFHMTTNRGPIDTDSLIIATGGLSVPKLGASDFGYAVAEQFGLRIIEPGPGLVPLTFHSRDLALFGALSGLSLDVLVRMQRVEFRENMLFTHRGISGPAILQMSSYWSKGKALVVNLLPDRDARRLLLNNHNSKMQITTVLDRVLPKRFTQKWFELHGGSRAMNEYAQRELLKIAEDLTEWEIIPSGTEGYGKAEVTVGGVDTNELSSKTMEAKKVPGLYFIGEVVDVTGWLGGYNFQWAWSSGWVAGQYA